MAETRRCAGIHHSAASIETRILSENFSDLTVYRLSDAACVQYKQIALFAVRRKRHHLVRDIALIESVRRLESLASSSDLDVLGENTAARYQIPTSGPAAFTNTGIPLDEVEDLLFNSSAYR